MQRQLLRTFNFGEETAQEYSAIGVSKALDCVHSQIHAKQKQ